MARWPLWRDIIDRTMYFALLTAIHVFNSESCKPENIKFAFGLGLKLRIQLVNQVWEESISISKLFVCIEGHHDRKIPLPKIPRWQKFKMANFGRNSRWQLFSFHWMSWTYPNRLISNFLCGILGHHDSPFHSYHTHTTGTVKQVKVGVYSWLPHNHCLVTLLSTQAFQLHTFIPCFFFTEFRNALFEELSINVQSIIQTKHLKSLPPCEKKTCNKIFQV
jgi:hypothetical protein